MGAAIWLGMIIDEQESRVVLATFGSENRKTGDMIQVWILMRDQSPVEGVRSGADEAICGNCPLRGLNGAGRTCYVNVGQAPQSTWRRYREGKHEPFDLEAFRGRKVRFGAYGDPVFVGEPIVHMVAGVSNGWTGYTHQWRNPEFSWAKQYFMASCEDFESQDAARRLGWRTFRVSSGTIPLTDEIECPSRLGVSCSDCGLCAGTSKRAKSIFIPVHGSGSKYL